MTDESLRKEFLRHRNKPLKNRSIQELWRSYNDSVPSSDHPRHVTVSMDPSDDVAQTVLASSDRGSPQSSNLNNWIQTHRYLRGDSGLSTDRNRLSIQDIDELFCPRCGNWRIAPSILPRRLRKRNRFAKDVEVGWEKRSIAVRVESESNHPPFLRPRDLAIAFERAVATWNRAQIGLVIRMTPDKGKADVIAKWVSPLTDPHALLSSNVLAHADFPPPNTLHTTTSVLPICFNRLAPWSPSVEGDSIDASRYDLESFALHELGHCIGLFHRGRTSIMYEIIDKGHFRTLDQETIDAAAALYS